MLRIRRVSLLVAVAAVIAAGVLSNMAVAGAQPARELVLSGGELTLVRSYSYVEARRFERGWNRGVDVLDDDGVVRAPVSGQVRYSGVVAGRGIVTIETMIDRLPVVVTVTGLDHIDVSKGARIDVGAPIGAGRMLQVGAYDPARRTRYLPVVLRRAAPLASEHRAASRSSIADTIAARMLDAITGAPSDRLLLPEAGSANAGERAAPSSGMRLATNPGAVPARAIPSEVSQMAHAAETARVAGIRSELHEPPMRAAGAEDAATGPAAWIARASRLWPARRAVPLRAFRGGRDQVVAAAKIEPAIGIRPFGREAMSQSRGPLTRSSGARIDQARGMGDSNRTGDPAASAWSSAAASEGAAARPGSVAVPRTGVSRSVLAAPDSDDVSRPFPDAAGPRMFAVVFALLVATWLGRRWWAGSRRHHQRVVRRLHQPPLVQLPSGRTRRLVVVETDGCSIIDAGPLAWSDTDPGTTPASTSHEHALERVAEHA